MAVEAGGIGARLRLAREKLGLTVLQVAERIHTDPKIVEALEAENFEALGAPVYARGHIRHYAELVGVSATELIALYADMNKVAQPDLTRIVKASPRTDSSKLVAPALLVLAVFAVAGAVWWVSALSKKKPQMTDTHVIGDESASQQASTAPGPAAGGAASPSTTSPVSGPTQSPTTAQARSGDRGSAPTGATAMSGQPRQGASAAGSNAGTSAGAGLNSGAQAARLAQGGAAGTATTAGATAAAGNAPAGAAVPVLPHSKNQAQVTLRYSADSWTEVYDASGARLFYDVGSANSVQTVVGTPPLRVVLGNAAGVAVEFNGHSTPIANLSHPDGSVQFSINRSGRVVRAKPSADGG